ncbi:hypothetical protein NPIL_242871 [Nephila pilipes]|uniref:Uncharacterized protein n=1 Tax=Nephila pilipes TaxID=299642 RepID=A0A8X6TTU8_NEPPI|nr:hypothetical protein NPIL_242871 [Nephila pilipes]
MEKGGVFVACNGTSWQNSHLSLLRTRHARGPPRPPQEKPPKQAGDVATAHATCGPSCLNEKEKKEGGGGILIFRILVFERIGGGVPRVNNLKRCYVLNFWNGG